MDKQEKVSIIMAVFNGEKTIEAAINSIGGQSYSSIELIVVDGGSTDNTMAIVNNYSNIISKVISEPDEGIADAWNKGLKLSTGTFVGFLNADDMHNYNTIKLAIDKLKDSNENTIIYGETLFLNSDETVVSRNSLEFNSKNITRGFGFMHPTCFCRRSIFDIVGLFDTSIKIAIDADWLIRAYKHNISFVKGTHKVLMRQGGISDKFRQKAYYEYLTALTCHNIINKSAVMLLKFKFLIKFSLSKIFSKRVAMSLKLQVVYGAIALQNFLYNVTPFFVFKNLLLRILRVQIGKRSYIHTNVKFFHIGKLNIGNNTTIGFNCYLDARRGLNIGNNVSISHNCKIYTLGHDIEDAGFICKGDSVTIKDKACIFANVIISPGVVIGEGAVVFPGAVVVKDVAPYTCVGGNPAKFIKHRNVNAHYSFNNKFWWSL
jgi:acetyltransferase-like isoleucine patch superfamily enzyme